MSEVGYVTAYVGHESPSEFCHSQDSATTLGGYSSKEVQLDNECKSPISGFK